MTATSMQFACSQCGQKLEVDLQWAGREANCPTCGQAIVVPGTAAAALGVQPHPTRHAPGRSYSSSVSGSGKQPAGSPFKKLFWLIVALTAAGFGYAMFH